jgi:para-nitrobenzyl esterase
MCNYWSNFIKNGDPNGNDADGSPMPQWKPYSAGERPMVFTDNPKMSQDDASGLMKFLLDYYLPKKQESSSAAL